MNGTVTNHTKRTSARRVENFEAVHVFEANQVSCSAKDSLVGVFSAYIGVKEKLCLQTCNSEMHEWISRKRHRKSRKIKEEK